jgi:DNA-binding NarL/FixJ family response regulator
VPPKQDITLNSRQSEVLYLLCKGLRNAEIAGQLNLSERTVKWYINQLFEIFQVTNRTELVGVLALQSPMFSDEK